MTDIRQGAPRQRLRVVVCGTTFGQFYLAALARLAEEFEVVGVLGKGSARSAACARRFDVPLFTDVGQLPDDVDLACVVVRSGVMGGPGTDLAMALLRRGIHVVQEQPVHHDDLVACLREARRHNVRYRLGDLYVRLPAVRRFGAVARALLARQPAVYVDAACSTQVAFPLLHILGDALPSVRPWRIAAVGASGGGPFTLLTGVIGGVPLTLRVHNEVDPADPDNHLHLLHRVTIGTEGGSLTLSDTHGPVLWNPRLHIPDAVKNRFDFADAESAHLRRPSATLLGPPRPPGYDRVLGELWPDAIGRDLLALRAAILGDPGAERPDQYHLTLSRMWQDVTSALGYPALREGMVHRPLPVGELLAAAATVEDESAALSAPPHRSADVLASAAAAAQAQVRGVTTEEVSTFVERLDEAVLSSMLLALQGHGVLDDPGRGHGEADILDAARVAPRHHGLIRQWLHVLAERGLITVHDGLLHGGQPVGTADAARDWDRAAEAWTGRLGSAEFIDYLRLNAERLPELMTGEQQAALLLFPEGRTGTADAVYRDTVTARYLNAAVGAAVRGFAAAAPEDRTLRVLEVGAGTGATTEAVARALAEDGNRVDYLFTDVSNFFLVTAKERFARHPWIRFGLFDIDQDPAEQGFSPGSVDVVVAAGVLNNARDTDATVRRLVELLAPGGRLLITEPTREHLEILASQAFMMTAPEDARQRTGTTFLSRGQWLEALAGAGVENVVVLPGEDHPLAPLGQRLFTGRKAAGPC
ncbi:bifunctional Gfo/Idh/MocA family oxidoreductase/class I SAM-dependent methyltransferase [Streptomyces sp. XD-27]|uniref:bifunctional Gfo/Idh/MocA family oxidoreductase/class I SAM-dependent methyltransferase n=1 Tax=Streptomyces sp. XD-27 TaxID=3062779 RepID=UPI0026F41426|nr:bifunctional Gfo/Idh/MocA family oxidoreductase/class I SAM-dependent methyltransferase [Streptomyces sp. XD-27]WKX69037.1 bifunctional Gfo/Idh/MocA family oxidoreductase/class I SAM-dependent methyltransferase [Streptomyces sp. XD-27]